MPQHVDADVQTGFLARWNATPALVAAFPGRLWSDDLPSGVEIPYAKVTSVAGDAREFQSAVQRADFYLDRRKVTIETMALTKAGTGPLIELVKAAFAFKTFPIPGSEFRACMFTGENIRAAEEKTKSGNRLWRGEVYFDVWLARPIYPKP